MRGVWGAKTHLILLMFKLQSRSFKDWTVRCGGKSRMLTALWGFISDGLWFVTDLNEGVTSNVPLVSSEEKKWKKHFEFAASLGPPSLSVSLPPSVRLFVLDTLVILVWTCAVFTRATPLIALLSLLSRSFRLQRPCFINSKKDFQCNLWGLPLICFVTCSAHSYHIALFFPQLFHCPVKSQQYGLETCKQLATSPCWPRSHQVWCFMRVNISAIVSSALTHVDCSNNHQLGFGLFSIYQSNDS